jgi:hypothetical protein
MKFYWNCFSFYFVKDTYLPQEIFFHINHAERNNVYFSRPLYVGCLPSSNGPPQISVLYGERQFAGVAFAIGDTVNIFA